MGGTEGMCLDRVEPPEPRIKLQSPAAQEAKEARTAARHDPVKTHGQNPS